MGKLATKQRRQTKRRQDVLAVVSTQKKREGGEMAAAAAAAKGYAARRQTTWSAGEQNKMLQLLFVLVFWAIFPAEEGGGSPGTTAILLTLAVCLVKGSRKKTSNARRTPRKPARPDGLSSAENGHSPAGSVEVAVNVVRTGGLTSTSADKYPNRAAQYQTPLPAPPRTSAAAAAASAAATTAAAASAAAAPLKTPASASEESSFEGAMTRLAGAAELGTEPLIYVRRVDVANMVDALMDIARTPAPAGPTVTSPALARLTLVRRSRRRDWTPGKGRRARSPMARSPVAREECPPSAFRRLGSPAFRSTHRRGGGGGVHGSGRREASASPASRSSSAAAVAVLPGGRALFQDMSSSSSGVSGGVVGGGVTNRITFRPQSPVGGSGTTTEGGTGGSGRRVRGAQEGKQRRLRRRVCSPSSVSLASSLASAGAVGAVGGVADAAAAAAAASGSSLRAVTMTPIALARNDKGPLTAASINGGGGGNGSGGNGGGGVGDDLTSSEQNGLGTPSLPLATTMRENSTASTGAVGSDQKIRCAPVIRRASGNREGSDFDDIWSSGWG